MLGKLAKRYEFELENNYEKLLIYVEKIKSLLLSFIVYWVSQTSPSLSLFPLFPCRRINLRRSFYLKQINCSTSKELNNYFKKKSDIDSILYTIDSQMAVLHGSMEPNVFLKEFLPALWTYTFQVPLPLLFFTFPSVSNILCLCSPFVKPFLQQQRMERKSAKEHQFVSMNYYR